MARQTDARYSSGISFVDPDRVLRPDGVVEIIQNAVIQHDPDSPDILTNLTRTSTSMSARKPLRCMRRPISKGMFR